MLYTGVSTVRCTVYSHPHQLPQNQMSAVPELLHILVGRRRRKRTLLAASGPRRLRMEHKLCHCRRRMLMSP